MLDIKLEGIQPLRKKLAAIPAELRRQERAAMHQAVLGLRDDARARIYTRDGRAPRGLRSDVTGSGAELTGRVQTRSKAARFSQRGRRPGGQPKTSRILRWLRQVQGSATPAQAFLVARAIARHGTKGHPIMQAVLEANKAKVIEQFKEALRQAVKRAN
jgi:hypothetical protein